IRHGRIHAGGRIRQPALSRFVVRNDRHVADSEAMTESFIVAEKKNAILLERTSAAGAELISPEWSDGTLIEEIARIERAVPEKFENRSVELVRSRLRDDGHLRSGPLSVLGGVCARQHVELAHRVD